ncbi:MAG: alpha/beta hydrolase [Blautia sp.]|nr:alpha/beta hydrolase [Blautia sp.]
MKRVRNGLILLVIALAVIGVVNRETVRVIWCNATSPKAKLDETKDWDGGRSYEKLPYSDVSENTYLNLYVPDTEEPAPLFVLVHGGGFVFNDCESRQAQFMYRYFRDHGYACASVNYRLAQEAPFPGAVDDMKAAIRFLKANAEQYGYNADKVAIWGESAGGYLCVMAGLTTDEDFHGVSFIGEDALSEPVTADVDVVVNFYGATQMEKSESDYDELGIPKVVRWAAGLWLQKALKGTGFDDVKSYWLRKDMKEMTEEEWNAYDPYYYMNKNMTAETNLLVLSLHGDADLDVPYLQTIRLTEDLGNIIGSEKVEKTLFTGFKHADDRFYSDENLAKIKEYLDHALCV